MAKGNADLSYCGQEVRKHDNDRFLTGLFAPAERREAVFALHAFNIEVAKTREVVTEPMIGQMRLQWWRDAVEAVYDGGAVPDHAVARPLAAAVAEHGLDRGHLDRLIDAREADLDDEPPPGMAALEAYAEATTAPLVLLTLETLGVRDASAARAARHVGTAYALAGLLRAVPFHASRGRVMLPADRLAAHGGRPREILDGKPGPAVRATAREVADAARRHLEDARALRRDVPKAALPALLPAVLATLHLDVLAREGFDPFAARVQMPNPFRQLRLGWAALRGRY